MNAADFPAGTDLKFQWDTFLTINPSSFHTSLLLNTDLELIFDIDVDNTGHGTQCIPSTHRVPAGRQKCKEAPTKNLVETYAFVSKLFVLSFIHAY